MNKIHRTTIISSLLLTLTPLSFTYGQVSQYVVEVKAPQATEQTPLAVSVELTQNTQIQKVLLHYREFGKTEFKNLDMLLTGRTAVAVLPAKAMTPPYIEYYISMRLADNKLTTFPLENPEMNPLKIQVKETDLKDLEVRFLSPESGETLPAEDLAIAVSLMFASDAVDKNSTRIYFDGADVTDEAIISDDVLLYSPKNFDRPLNLGTHSIDIELRDTLGKVYYKKQTNFNLSTATAMEEERALLQYTGNGQVEIRNEKIDVNSNAYIRGDVHANGTYKYLTFGGDIHLTNEEKSNRQPQNRYLATVQAENYAKLQIGDAYPVFPSLIVSGKRVRGITGSFTVGFFNLDVTYGKTDRAIEGTLGQYLYYDTSATPLKESVVIGKNSTGDTIIARQFSSGTYARNFFAIRPSFGIGENFQFGLTYMKAKDDVGSIKYGTYPHENFAVGTDLLLAFDDQKIRWTAQAALSLENIDISLGDYTDDEIRQRELADAITHEDTVEALQDADDLIKVAKIGRHFITMNEQIVPFNPIKGMPSLAIESELSLNYFDNYLRAMIFRRGNKYKSYGNDFLQTDIAGINISDRVRLLDNKLMASISYETKWNNTQNDVNTPTTTYNTLNTSVTAYPGVNLPSFTAGYARYTRKNPIELHTAIISSGGDTATFASSYIDSLLIADEITNRFFLAANYDFQMIVRNTATATISIAAKKDNTYFKRDQNSVNFSSSVTSFYDIPLQTTLAFIISHNVSYWAIQDTAAKSYSSNTQEQAFNYQTISLSARYRMMNDRLNLMAMLAPTFGDFKRLLIQTGAEYQVGDNHYLIGEFDFIQNSDRGNDIIFSIVYRFMF